MADNIDALYERAKKKGVLHQSMTPERFRQEVSTDNGLRSFYDYAGQHGMKFHDYETFAQNVRGVGVQSAPAAPAASTTQPESRQPVAAPMPVTTGGAYAPARQAVQPATTQPKDASPARPTMLPGEADARRQMTWVESAAAQLHNTPRYEMKVDENGVLQTRLTNTPQSEFEEQAIIKQNQLDAKYPQPKNSEEAANIWMQSWTETPEGKMEKEKADNAYNETVRNMYETYRNNSDKYKAMLGEYQGVVKRVQDAYWKKFEESQQFADIRNAIQEKVNAGTISVEDANKEFNAQLNEAFNETYMKAIGENADVQKAYKKLSDGAWDSFVADNKDELEKGQAAAYKAFNEKGMKAGEGYLGKQSERFMGESVAALDKETKEILSELKGLDTSAVGLARRGGFTPLTKEQSNAQSALKYVEDAKKIIEAVRQKKGFFGGLGSALGDIDTWDLGMGELMKNTSLLQAINKLESGKELTKDEQLLLDAATNYMAVSGYYSDKLGRGYKAGQTTGASIPFMLEFIATPVSGVENAVSRGLLKYGLKKFGIGATKRVLRAGDNAVVKGVGILAKDALLGAPLMTATWGAPKVAAGTADRMVGQLFGEEDENGRLRYAGRENAQGLGEALRNSGLDMYIENFSEMAFNSLEPMGKFLTTTKAFEKVAASDLAKSINMFRAQPWVRDVASRAQFQGYFPEVWEEEVGGLLRMATMSDVNTLQEAGLDLDAQIDTHLGLLPTSIAFGLIGLGSGAAHRIGVRRSYRQLRKEVNDEERAMFDNMMQARSYEDFQRDAHDLIRSVLTNENYDDAKRKEIIGLVMEQGGDILGTKVHQDEIFRQEEQAKVEGITNKSDGNVYAVQQGGVDGYVTSGDVKTTTAGDGTMKIEGGFVTVKKNDGSVWQGSADELTATAAPVSAEDMVEQNVQTRMSQYDVSNTFKPGMVVNVTDYDRIPTGSSTKVLNVTPEGVEVLVSLPNGITETTIVPNDVAMRVLQPALGVVEQGDRVRRFRGEDGSTIDIIEHADGRREWADGAGELDAEGEFEAATGGMTEIPAGEATGDNDGGTPPPPEGNGAAVQMADEDLMTYHDGIYADQVRAKFDAMSPAEQESYLQAHPKMREYFPSVRTMPTPKQQAEELVSAMGEEKARKKVQTTVDAINKRIADTQAKLDKAQQELDDMPMVFDEESRKAEEKAKKSVETLTDLLRVLGNQKQQYDGMLGEMGEKKVVDSTENAQNEAKKPEERTFTPEEQKEYEKALSNVREAGERLASASEELDARLDLGLDTREAEAAVNKANADHQKAVEAYRKFYPKAVFAGRQVKRENIDRIKAELQEQMAKKEDKLTISNEQLDSMAREYAALRVDYLWGHKVLLGKDKNGDNEYRGMTEAESAERDRKVAETEGNLRRAFDAMSDEELLQWITDHDKDYVDRREYGWSVNIAKRSLFDRATNSEEKEVARLAEEYSLNLVTGDEVKTGKWNKRGENIMRKLTEEDKANMQVRAKNAMDQMKSILMEMNIDRLKALVDKLDLLQEYHGADAARDTWYIRTAPQSDIDFIKRHADEQPRVIANWLHEIHEPNFYRFFGNADAVAEYYSGNKTTDYGARKPLPEDATPYQGKKNVKEGVPNPDLDTVPDAYENAVWLANQGRMDEAMNVLREWVDETQNPELAALVSEEGMEKQAIKHVVKEYNKWFPEHKLEYKSPKAKKAQTTADNNQVPMTPLEKAQARQDEKEAQEAAAIMEKYNAIKEKYPDTMILFREGDFYELYNEDSTDAAKVLKIKSVDRYGLKMSGFPIHAVDTYLPKLIAAGKRVAFVNKGTVEEVVTPKSKLDEQTQQAAPVNRLEEYVKDMPQVKRGKVMDVLGKQFNYSESGAMTRAEHTEKMVNEGREFFVNFDNGKANYGVYSADKSKYTEITKIEYDYAAHLGANVTPEDEVQHRKDEDRYRVLMKKYEYPSERDTERNIERLEGWVKRVNVNTPNGKRVQDELNDYKEIAELRAKKAQWEQTQEQKKLDAARQQVDTNPTDAQKEAGNYKKGHVNLFGFDITLENPKGSTRSGKDADGKAWSITMQNDYGYIRGTESVDGDHIDIYLGDNTASEKVFVMDAINQKTGAFDEHKVLLGFDSADAALEAYLANYEKGWKPGTLTEVSLDEFRKWIESSHRKTKPFAEYKNVKTEGAQGTPAASRTREEFEQYIGDIEQNPSLAEGGVFAAGEYTDKARNDVHHAKWLDGLRDDYHTYAKRMAMNIYEVVKRIDAERKATGKSGKIVIYGMPGHYGQPGRSADAMTDEIRKELNREYKKNGKWGNIQVGGYIQFYGKDRESIHDMKLRGEDTSSVDYGFYFGERFRPNRDMSDILSGEVVVIIDDVIGRGQTADAILRAVPPTAEAAYVVAYANDSKVEKVNGMVIGSTSEGSAKAAQEQKPAAKSTHDWLVGILDELKASDLNDIRLIVKNPTYKTLPSVTQAQIEAKAEEAAKRLSDLMKAHGLGDVRLDAHHISEANLYDVSSAFANMERAAQVFAGIEKDVKDIRTRYKNAPENGEKAVWKYAREKADDIAILLRSANAGLLGLNAKPIEVDKPALEKFCLDMAGWKSAEETQTTHGRPTDDPRETHEEKTQESLSQKRYWNGRGYLGDDIVGKVLNDYPDISPKNDWGPAKHTGISTSQLYNEVAQDLEWHDQMLTIAYKTQNSDIQLVVGGLRDRIVKRLPMLSSAEFDRLAAAMNVSESNLKRDNLTAMGLLHAEYLTRGEEPKYIRDLRDPKNAGHLVEMVHKLSERKLEEASLRYPVEAVKNEVLRREGLDPDTRAFDNLKKVQTMERGTAKKAVYTPSNYVVTDEALRPVMWGVFHENGMKVTTDAHILFAIKDDYPAENEGKILLDPSLDKTFRSRLKKEMPGQVAAYTEKLPVIEGRYPNWRAVVPHKDTAGVVVSKVDVKDLRNFLAGAMDNLRKDWKALREADPKMKETQEDYKRQSAIAIRFADGGVGIYKTIYLERFAEALELLGADEVFYTSKDGQKTIVAETDKGTVLLMPIVGGVQDYMSEPWEGAVAQDSPVDMGGKERMFVYDLSAKKSGDTPDGGGKRPKTTLEKAKDRQAAKSAKADSVKAAASTPGAFADNGASATSKREKIEDVGEKIGGARKDIVMETADRINVNGETFAQIFPKFDLPKLIEKGLDPKYAAGLKFVIDHSKGQYKAQKKRLGRGPRAEQKALDLVRFMAAYAKGFLKGDTSTEFEAHGWHFTEYGKLNYAFGIDVFNELYKVMGNDMFAVDLSQSTTDIEMTEEERKRHMEERGEKYYPNTRTFYRDGKEFTPRYEMGLGGNTKYFTADEKRQAIDYFVETVQKATDYKSTHKYKLGVYYSNEKTADGKTQYFVGTKIGGKLIELTPRGPEYTLSYMQEHNEELQLAAERKAAEVKEQNKEARKIATVERQQEWNPDAKRWEYFLATKIDKEWVPVSDRYWPEGMRSEDYRTFLGKLEDASEAALTKAQQLLDEYMERKEEGKGWKPEMNIGQLRPRVGVDWRAGEDVSAEKLRDTFGFRGVEFGNYVTQKERQQYINECFDSLMDMAQLLDVSPRALSLNGQLGLAIGARGKGGAKAHYEPEKNVINLTKSSGWGALAHEWWHAMDFYFGQREKAKSATQDMFSPDTRTEVQKAFAHMMDVMKNSTEYGKRSQALDKFTGKKYYATPTEMGARAFQDYVVRMLTSRSQVNDFLSHYTSAEDWNGKPETYPYPVGKEGEEIAKAMLNLFDTLEEATDATTGNVRLYQQLTGTEDSQGVEKYDRGLTEAEQVVTDAVTEVLDEAGIMVNRISNEEADEMGETENVRYSFSTDKKSFDEQFKEVEKHGFVINSDIKNKIVPVVAIEDHPFKGAKLFDQARAWAKEHIMTTEEDVKIGNLPRLKDGTPYRIPRESIKKFLEGDATSQSVNPGLHVAALMRLRDIIGDSVEGFVHLDFNKVDGVRLDKNGHTNDSLVHVLYGAIQHRGKVYRVKTTMIEHAIQDQGNIAHSYEVTNIEPLDVTQSGSIMEQNRTNSENGGLSIPAAKLIQKNDISKYFVKKTQISFENAQIPFQKVGKRSEIERLESEPTIKLYRSMQTFPDRPGEFFPPMAAVVNGEMQGQKMGEWYKADEHPELLIPNMGKDGVQKMYDGKADNAGKPNYKFRLNKGESQVEGKKMTTVDAAYNPYFHSSTTMLNDQFAQAVDRPNMVTVEIEVPERELKGEYSAQYAKDHTGMHEWKAGPVQAKLTGTRQVMLSQYCKIVRVVPNEEVAKSIAKQLEGSNVAIPFNVLPPALRTELEKLGVAISDQDTRAGVQKKGRAMQEVSTGRVYGWSQNGEITLAERGLNPNTPVHEYTHLWTAAVRKNNPELWQNIKDLFKDNPLVDAVRKDEQYQGLDEDGIMDEVLARYSGKRGAERLEGEAKQMLEENPTVLGKARVRNFISRIREALNKMWEWVGKNLFHIKEFKSQEEVADRIMYDLFNKTNLGTGEVGAGNMSAKKMAADYMEAAKEGNTEKAADLVKAAAEKAGYTIHAYHGTGRADRVGNVFLPERATSGPMAFFTSDKEIATNYSKSKKDTSLEYEDLDLSDYHQRFTVQVRGKALPIEKAWGYVPFDVRRKIRTLAGNLREDWENDSTDLIVDTDNTRGLGNMDYLIDREYRGNVIAALVDGWLDSGHLFDREADFLKVLEATGVADAMRNLGLGEIKNNDPYYRDEKVYDVYLRMTNPFDTDNGYTKEWLDGLNKWYDALEDKSKYMKGTNGADQWDKNNKTIDLWNEDVEYDLQNNTTYAWTSIPDYVTDYLKSLGYDGIVDKGGKYSGLDHKVYIPFESSQVKSAEPITRDDKGEIIPLDKRFDLEQKDIRYSASNEAAATFYSNAAAALGRIKQEKATPEQWLAMLTKEGGIKAGEDKWMGLSDWLRQSEAKTLTKGEVMQFVRDNAIQIEEVKYSEKDETQRRNATIADMMEDDYTTENLAEGYGLPEGSKAYRIYTDVAGELYEPLEWMAIETPDGKWLVGDGDRNTEVASKEAAFRELCSMLGLRCIDREYLKKMPEDKSWTRPINSLRLQYTTFGLENNREIALTIPTIEQWNQADNIHFGDAGNGRAVAWIRFGETKDEDGKRVLVIDEIQSKRHQEGRSSGYKSIDAEKRYIAAQKAMDQFGRDMYKKYGSDWEQMTEEERARQGELNIELVAAGDAFDEFAVPDAPFDKNWAELAFKRMLRLAAEEGYDRLAWTTGKQQSKRYNLGGIVDRVEAGISVDGQRMASVYTTKQSETFWVDFDDNGTITNIGERATSPLAMNIQNGDNISSLFGKELADKMLAQTERGTKGMVTYSGDDMAVGLNGMQAFYDQMLPSFVKKYVKKWGATVEDVTLSNVEESGRVMHSVTITPEMRESVMLGQPMFQMTEGNFHSEEPTIDDDGLLQKLNDLAKFAGEVKEEVRGSRDIAENLSVMASMRRREAAKQIVGEVKDEDAHLVHEAMDADNRANSLVSRVAKRLQEVMRAQKEYSASTVYEVVRLARLMVRGGWMDNATRSEVIKVLDLVAKSSADSKEYAKRDIDRLVNILAGIEVKHAEDEFKKYLDFESSHARKVNISDVATQGRLDIRGQEMVKACREAMNSARMTPEVLEEKMAEEYRKAGAANSANHENVFLGRADGYAFAKMYKESVVALQQAREEILQELETLKNTHNIPTQARSDARHAIEMKLFDNSIEMMRAYINMQGMMSETISAGRSAAKEWALEMLEHKERIRGLGDTDLKNIPGNIDKVQSPLSRALQMRDFLLNPARTLESMLRALGWQHSTGEGELYEHFVRGSVRASEKMFEGLERDYKEMDEKASEIMGKKCTWAEMQKELNKLPGATVRYLNADPKVEKEKAEMVDHDLTQGNLAYIYAVAKMEDGMMKLNAMGISQEDIDAVTAALDPRMKAAVDWLQGTFFHDTRVRYNEVHMRLFGAPMDKIKNYFPLRINKGAIKKEETLDDNQIGFTQMAGTSTGSIKVRTVNTKPLDILNADALSIGVEHVEEMEHWAAYAELVRDGNVLFSSERFRNRLDNISSMYGYKEDFRKNLRDAFRVALGAYQPESDVFGRALLPVVKGVTAAKISGRWYTALKQLASHPAFLSYLTDEGFAKEYAHNLAHPMETMQWAEENLPLLRKRVLKGDMGNYILVERKSEYEWFKEAMRISTKYGMAPNRFVDAMTCAQGAKAVYESRYRKYLKMGMSETDATQRAREDAEIAFNKSQQSNEGAFLSTIQSDRSWMTVILSNFRNSNMAYTRNFLAACKAIKEQVKHKDEQIEYMTVKNMQQYGISREAAEQEAKNTYDRDIARNTIDVVVYGFLLNTVWVIAGKLPYLIFGDDDDKKKELAKQELLGPYGAKPVAMPLFGVADGHVLDEIVSGTGSIEEIFRPESPIANDIATAKRQIQGGRWAEFANTAINLCVQMGTGFNPETLESFVVALYNNHKTDGEQTADDILMDVMALLNVPETQRRQFYLDRLDAQFDGYRDWNTLKNSEMYERLRKTYIDEQLIESAPTTFWMRSEEETEKSVKSFGRKFDEMAKERMEIRGKMPEKKN